MTPPSPAQAEIARALDLLPTREDWVQSATYVEAGDALVLAADLDPAIECVIRRFVAAKPRRCLIGALAGLQDYASTNIATTLCEASLPFVADVILAEFSERIPQGNPALGCMYSPDWVVPVFNDHPLTSFEDVRLVLEKALTQVEELV